LPAGYFCPNTFHKAALNCWEQQQYTRKLEEKLNMTRRWATDSRHITHSGGMYSSVCFIQETWTSTKATTMTPRKTLRALLHEDDGDESDGKIELTLSFVILSATQNLIKKMM